MPPVDEGTLETLALFAEKYRKLQRSTVWRAIEDGSIKFSLKAQRGEPIQLQAEGPDEEAVDAFVLTLRFFLQNNESISIGNMAAVVADLPISEKVKDRVAVGREKFNTYLDSPCGIKVDGHHPTNRELLDIFVYGGMAHASPTKRRIFISWAVQPLVFGIMSQVFFACLRNVLVFLAFLDANLREGLGVEEPTESESDGL